MMPTTMMLIIFITLASRFISRHTLLLLFFDADYAALPLVTLPLLCRAAMPPLRFFAAARHMLRRHAA